MNKKGKADGGSVMLLVLAIFLAIVGAFAAGKYLGLFSVGGGGLLDDGDDGGTNQCVGGETQSLTINAARDETGDAIQSAFAYRKAGQIAWSSGITGTALTGLDVGSDYEFVPGVTASAETGYAYGQKFVINNLPCRKTYEIEMANHTLYSDMTGTFYNSDNNAAAETFSVAGSTKCVKIKWNAANKEWAGNKYLAMDSSTPTPDPNHRKAYPNTLCMNLNSTNMDVPDSVSVNGVDMHRVSVPTVHAATASYISYCFEQGPSISDTEQYTTICLNADDTYIPVQDFTASLYTGSYYINSLDKSLNWGVETDDGNFVGFTAAETVTIDLTA